MKGICFSCAAQAAPLRSKGQIQIQENPIQQTERLLASEVIRPALEAEKIPWYGGHAFRRGLATNLHRLGVSDKVIQQILRHANGPPQLIFT
jgi:integrase